MNDVDDQATPTPLQDALRRDLAAWGPKVAGSSLAAAALNLALTLDDPKVNATPRSMLHAQYRATMLELMKLAPEEATNDGIDELGAKRNERRGA